MAGRRPSPIGDPQEEHPQGAEPVDDRVGAHPRLVLRRAGRQPGLVILDVRAGDVVWVPKTYATWADALRVAVGSVPCSVPGGQVFVRPEVR